VLDQEAKGRETKDQTLKQLEENIQRLMNQIKEGLIRERLFLTHSRNTILSTIKGGEVFFGSYSRHT
jgi:hypothetical protein